MITKFQKDLVKQLREGKLHYGDASIYTILLDLCQGNDPQEVFEVLKEVVQDLEKKIIIEIS